MSDGLKVVRVEALCELLGVSRTTLWRWERDGRFPPHRQLGPNVIGWLETEVSDWLESRPKGSIE